MEWSITMNGATTKARSQGRSASVITTVPRLAAVALIGAGLLSACSGAPGTTTAEKTAGSATAAKPTDTATGKATGKATSKGGTTGAGVGARADLSDFSCDAASTGVWSAKGTLHNATNATVKYSVMVSVASTKTSTVVGSTTKTVTLDAGKSEQFTVDQVATHKPDGLACTAHVTRVSST
jgi:hypothetical protein